MAHQDITQVVKCELQFASQNNNAENVLHAHYTGVLVGAHLDALNAIIQTWLADIWASTASIRWSAVQIVLTDQNSLNGPRRSYPIEPTIDGTDGGVAMPANATLAVKADTGTRGRGKNGRLYWIGLTDTVVTGSSVNAAYANSLATGLDALNTAVAATAPFTGLVVPHLVVGGIRPPVATSSPIVGFAITDFTVDSQRDRLPGHKRHKRRP
jgi:hypothetical protein